MANYKADNFLKIPHNGVYGNDSRDLAQVADLGLINGGAGLAVGDTLDLHKIPAGSTVMEGFLFAGTTVLATSTVVVGIRAADGTSTMASGAAFGTGTAVLVGGTASAITAALTQYSFRVVPFTIDFDAIAYITWLSPGAPVGAVGAQLSSTLLYVANGTK